MKEPIRLVHDAAASPSARDLLRRASEVGPTPAQSADLWSALESTLGGGPGGGDGGPGGPGGGGGGGPSIGTAGGGAGAAAATSGAIAPKVATSVVVAQGATSAASVWVAISAAALLTVGGIAVATREPAPTKPTVVEDTRIEVKPVETAVNLPGTGTGVDGVQPRWTESTEVPEDRRSRPQGTGTGMGNARSAAPVQVPAPVSSAAQEEVAATRVARERLRGGDPVGALVLLRAADARFGGGLLQQERAALTVDALGRAGQTARASDLAHAFLARWPESAHAGGVRPWAR